jgi:hypothetical protein
MLCEVFKITNMSEDEVLEIQYTACSDGLSDGHTILTGETILVCSYCHPYITKGLGKIETKHNHELIGLGAPNK